MMDPSLILFLAPIQYMVKRSRFRQDKIMTISSQIMWVLTRSNSFLLPPFLPFSLSLLRPSSLPSSLSSLLLSHPFPPPTGRVSSWCLQWTKLARLPCSPILMSVTWPGPHPHTNMLLVTWLHVTGSQEEDGDVWPAAGGAKEGGPLSQTRGWSNEEREGGKRLTISLVRSSHLLLSPSFPSTFQNELQEIMNTRRRLKRNIESKHVQWEPCARDDLIGHVHSDIIQYM